MDPAEQGWRDATGLLSLTYMGPVAWYARFVLHGTILIEQHDNYQKQSWRNRCRISGANGVIDLTVPVRKGSGHKQKVKDVRIEYGKQWMKLHIKAIESAYRSSPFYEFYIDELLDCFKQKHQFLADLNICLHEVIMGQLGLDTRWKLTDAYRHEPGQAMPDYRELVHPKADIENDPGFTASPYHQVFSERFGFQPNLSIIDLLFNEGPGAPEILSASLNRSALPPNLSDNRTDAD